MKTKPILAAGGLLLLLFSCNRNAKNATTDKLSFASVEQKETPAFNGNKKLDQIPLNGSLQASADSASIPPPLTKPAANPDWDKKIIKTATLKLEVKDFKKTNENVHTIVRKYGGYIAAEEQNLTDERTGTVASIKVPADHFEDMMNELSGGEAKVMERKITTEDVTGQVIDTRSRLEAKKQMRLKYLDFLKQSKNMEEVLQVQNEINNIQEEIESAAGRIEYLSHQSTFSTINLNFYQPMAGFVPVDESPGFLKKLAAAFKTGAAGVASLFIGFMTVWPLWLFVFAAIFFVRRFNSTKNIQQKS